jgi:TRAP-type mannitol/chloroaromatic compound transport system substrate-binding protein
MKIGLSRSKLSIDDLAKIGLDLDNLTNARVFCVLEKSIINAGGSEYVILGLGDELTIPDSDPLVIGTIYQNGNYVLHAVWDDKAWHILSNEGLELLSMATGLKVEDLARTAEKLINETRAQRQGVDIGDVSSDPK